MVAGLAALTLLVLAFVRVPRPPVAAEDGAARPLVEIAAQPRYLTAVTGALVGYSVMNLLMTSTPLAMETRTLPFTDTASVIQWHVLGMFAPSFFTGPSHPPLRDAPDHARRRRLQAACVAVNLSGDTYVHFLCALLLLGLGWNFLFIGATTLLTETYTAREKAKAQGFNDLLVFTVVTFTAISSGYLHFELGWRSLNLGVVPLLVLVAAAIAWLSRMVRSPPSVRPVIPIPEGKEDHDPCARRGAVGSSGGWRRGGCVKPGSARFRQFSPTSRESDRNE